MSMPIAAQSHINQLLAFTGHQRPGHCHTPPSRPEGTENVSMGDRMASRLEKVEARSETIPAKLEELGEIAAERFANMEQRALDNGNQDHASAIAQRAEIVGEGIDALKNNIGDRLTSRADHLRTQLEEINYYDASTEDDGLGVDLTA